MLVNSTLDSLAIPLKIHPRLIMLALAGISILGAVGIAFVFSINPLYAIAGLLGLGIVYAIVQKPEVGVLLLAFMTWTRFSDIIVSFHGAPSVAKLFVPFLMGIIILRWMIYKEKPKGWQLALILISITVFVNGLSLVYATDFGIAKGKFIDTIKDALIALVVVILLKDLQIFRQTMWVFVGVGIFLGSISVIQYITGDFTNNYWGFGQAHQLQIVVGQAEGYRIAGNVGDPNAFAQILMLLVPISLNRMQSAQKSWAKALAGWSFAVTVLAIIFTFSRGAFVSLMAIFLVMAILNPPKLSTIVAGIVLFVMVLPFVPQEYTERMSSLVSIIPGVGEESVAGVEDGAIRGRTSHLFVGLGMFTDYPIFGIGYGHFGYHYQTYSRPLGINTATREGRSAHNRWLEVFAEQGIVGAAAYFSLLGGIYFSITRARRKLENIGQHDDAEMIIAFGVGAIGYFAASTFLSDDYPRFFWLIFGIGLSAINIAQVAVTQFTAKATTKTTQSSKVQVC